MKLIDSQHTVVLKKVMHLHKHDVVQAGRQVVAERHDCVKVTSYISAQVEGMKTATSMLSRLAAKLPWLIDTALCVSQSFQRHAERTCCLRCVQAECRVNPAEARSLIIPLGRLVVPEVCRNSATSSGRGLSRSGRVGGSAMRASRDLAHSTPLPESAMFNLVVMLLCCRHRARGPEVALRCLFSCQGGLRRMHVAACCMR